MSKRYIVVGQGLAGTLVSWFLLKAGQDVLVYQQFAPNSASQVAAGIMNPVTGRYYVKTWLADQIFPKAFETYKAIEAETGAQFLDQGGILRVLPDIKTENDFFARLEGSALSDLIEEVFRYEKPGALANKTIIRIKNSGRCRLDLLCNAYNQWLKKQGRLIETPFDYNSVNDTDSYIFCEGVGIRNNPFFSDVALSPAKGEVFIAQVPNLPFPKDITKLGLYYVPNHQENTFWVGSNFDKNDTSDLPSQHGADFLTGNITADFGAFHKIEHKAAFRPATYDRKPFIGQHKTLKNLYLFNGLGSKGSTLGPYFADLLTQNITNGTPLPTEVYPYRRPK